MIASKMVGSRAAMKWRVIWESSKEGGWLACARSSGHRSAGSPGRARHLGASFAAHQHPGSGSTAGDLRGARPSRLRRARPNRPGSDRGGARRQLAAGGPSHPAGPRGAGSNLRQARAGPERPPRHRAGRTSSWSWSTCRIGSRPRPRTRSRPPSSASSGDRVGERFVLRAHPPRQRLHRPGPPRHPRRRDARRRQGPAAGDRGPDAERSAHPVLPGPPHQRPSARAGHLHPGRDRPGVRERAHPGARLPPGGGRCRASATTSPTAAMSWRPRSTPSCPPGGCWSWSAGGPAHQRAAGPARGRPGGAPQAHRRQLPPGSSTTASSMVTPTRATSSSCPTGASASWTSGSPARSPARCRTSSSSSSWGWSSRTARPWR